MRVRPAALLVCLLLLAAAPAAAAPPRTASTGLHLHVGGGDCRESGPGTPDRPFCSPAEAVRAAPAGATVLLRAGSYPLLRLEGVAKDRPVTVAPARGARVVVAGAELTDVRGLRLRDLVLTDGVDADRTEGLQVLRTEIALRPAGAGTHSGVILGQSRDVVLRGNLVHGGRDAVVLRGHLPRNEDVTIVGNTFRRMGNDGVFVGRSSRRVLIAGNHFDDIRVRAEVDPMAHSDGIQVSGPTEDVAVWGNRFTGGRGIIVAVFDRARGANHGLVVADNVVLGPMFGIRTFSTPGARIVNNTVWGTSQSPNSGIDVRNRLFAANGGSAGMVLANNVIKVLDVDPALRFATRAGNLVATGPRTARDLAGVPAFVALAAGDARLAAGSPGVDAALPAWAPAVDADGGARVGRPDVGAYEHGAQPSTVGALVRAALAALRR